MTWASAPRRDGTPADETRRRGLAVAGRFRLRQIAGGWHSVDRAALSPPPARVLDAGCGDGALSAWLARLGYQVTAIDVDPAAVARARASGVPAVQADLAS